MPPSSCWLAASWLVLACALLLADWQLTPPPAAWEVRRSHDARLSLAARNRAAVTLRPHIEAKG